jgi:anti-anti-sigma factor
MNGTGWLGRRTGRTGIMGTGRELSGQQASAAWEVTTGGGNTLVRLSGEIDLAAVQGPTEGIFGGIRPAVEGAKVVLCDLSGVTYLDSSGFHLLVKLKRTVERGEGRFLVSRPTNQVRDLLRIAGGDAMFEIVD